MLNLLGMESSEWVAILLKSQRTNSCIGVRALCTRSAHRAEKLNVASWSSRERTARLRNGKGIIHSWETEVGLLGGFNSKRTLVRIRCTTKSGYNTEGSDSLHNIEWKDDKIIRAYIYARSYWNRVCLVSTTLVWMMLWIRHYDMLIVDSNFSILSSVED